jgi:hypothetical protein
MSSILFASGAAFAGVPLGVAPGAAAAGAAPPFAFLAFGPAPPVDDADQDSEVCPAGVLLAQTVSSFVAHVAAVEVPRAHVSAV